MIKKEVTISGRFELKGTLTIPNEKEKFTTIIIVNGSGPSNRDGNIGDMKMNIYKDLSDFLVDNNFMTLRYDKRGCGESQGNANSVGMWDLIDDIVCCIDFVKSTKNSNNKVILLGHSEGCILNTLLTTKKDIDGLILLAGGGTSIKETLKYQMKNQNEEIKNLKGFKGFLLRLLVKEKKAIKVQNDLFEKCINSTYDIIKIKGKEIPAKWFREHLSINEEYILGILKNIKIPTIAITGNKDAQVDYKDLDKINNLKNNKIETKIIDNMDHLLKYFDKEISMINLMSQYKEDNEKEIHKDLKEEIIKYLNKNF